MSQGKVEYSADGRTKTVSHRMSDFIRTLPTFSQWKLFMGTKKEHGSLSDGEQVLFACIACGAEHRTFEMSPIVIGAVIRMEKDNHSYSRGEGVFVVEKAYKPIPVSKKGLGCPTCYALFEIEVAKVNRYNAANEKLDSINAQLARLIPGREFKSSPRMTPWLNVLEGGCGDCKGTKHVWSPENGQYVKCHCFHPVSEAV